MYYRPKNIITKHDDGDVDEIVGNQDSGEGTLAIVAKHLYITISITTIGVKFREVCGRQTEKSDLWATGKSWQHQEQARQDNGNVHPKGGHLYINVSECGGDTLEIHNVNY